MGKQSLTWGRQWCLCQPSFSMPFGNFPKVLFYLWLWRGRAHHTTYMEVLGQLCGADPLLPPLCGFSSLAQELCTKTLIIHIQGKIMSLLKKKKNHLCSEDTIGNALLVDIIEESDGWNRVVLACNPRFSGGWGREVTGSAPSGVIEFSEALFKNNEGWRESSVVGLSVPLCRTRKKKSPEQFMYWYHLIPGNRKA